MRNSTMKKARIFAKVRNSTEGAQLTADMLQRPPVAAALSFFTKFSMNDSRRFSAACPLPFRRCWLEKSSTGAYIAAYQ
jgi:hypothetical protein